MLAVRANASMPKDGSEGMVAPFRSKAYVVAEQPDATLYPGALIHNDDDNVPAYSDGAAWLNLAGAADITALQAAIDAAEADIATLQSDLTTLQGTVTTLSGTVSTLSGTVTTLSGTVSTLSSTVSALPAYTEGTWTPTVAFGGSSTGVTYGTRVGTYIKHGKSVILTARIVLTNNGTGTGVMTISGFSTTPGTAATITSAVWTGSLGTGTGNTGTSFAAAPYCAISSAGTTIGFFRGDGAGTGLDQGDFTDTASFSLEIAYQAA
jgi:hypothetical protein